MQRKRAGLIVQTSAAVHLGCACACVWLVQWLGQLEADNSFPLKYGAGKVEFRTRVCVVVRQTEGLSDNLSHRVEGQHVFVVWCRSIDEVLQFPS